MDSQSSSNPITIPAAIIIAGALIAVAVIWVNKPSSLPTTTQNIPTLADVNMRVVNSSDHILGNPNAPIKIVEYSDASCPACKMFNSTMVQIMDEYGPTGQVAWIYRHFPLDKMGSGGEGRILHKNAGNEAQALECAASIGGNEKFWVFEKQLYEITPSVTQTTPDGLDQKKLPEIAKSVGVDVALFNECLADKRFADKVEADYTDGLDAGVTGTPYSIVITPSGSKIPITGTLPYANLKTAIDALLAEAKQ